MPDDPPFGTSNMTSSVPPGASPYGGNGASHEEPAPEGTPETPNSAVTPEQLNAALAEAIKPFSAKIDSLMEENRALREQAAAPPPREEPPMPATEGDFLTRFTTNPEEALDDRITKAVKSAFGELAPLISGLADVAHAGVLAGHQQQIDSQFGPGTWEAEFSPVLDKLVADTRKTNPALLANRGWFDKEIASLKGWKMDQLVERRTKFKEAEEAESAKDISDLTNHLLNSTNLMGGLRGPTMGQSKELSEAEKDYIRARQEATGETLDAKTLRANLSTSRPGIGTTYDEWKASQAAKEGSK